MAINKKYIGKITEDNIDEWLHSFGYLFPENENHLQRFDKIYENYDFKLKERVIDINSIIKGELINNAAIIPLTINLEVNTEIESFKMVARKGLSDLPQHIIDKMRQKHKDSNDSK